MYLSINKYIYNKYIPLWSEFLESSVKYFNFIQTTVNAVANTNEEMKKFLDLMLIRRGYI